MVVRRVYLATITDSESKPFEDSRETEISQPLLIAPSPIEEFQPLAARTTPAASDHTLISYDSTPVSPLNNEELKVSEPLDIGITLSHSTASSDFTTPLSSDHPLTQTSPTSICVLYYQSIACMVVRTQPTLSPGMSAQIAEAAALSPSSFRKRYRGTSDLVEDTEDESLDSDTERMGLEDEGPSSEEEEATPEVLPSSPLVPTLVASPVTTLEATIAVDEDEFLERELQKLRDRFTILEREGSHRGKLVVDSLEVVVIIVLGGSCTKLVNLWMAHLDALPPALFEGYNGDLRELYTRSRVVRDEIFSQRYRLKSLEQEHKKATVTFGAIWRPVLALESWQDMLMTKGQRCGRLGMMIIG
nr:hypothetical protein [Tanacetum cinerariifolium]